MQHCILSINTTVHACAFYVRQHANSGQCTFDNTELDMFSQENDCGQQETSMTCQKPQID
jgi:hypothetical protein